MLPPETVSTTYPTLPRRHPREVTMHVAPAAIARCCIITTRGIRVPPAVVSDLLAKFANRAQASPLLRSWRNRDQALLGGFARTFVRSGGSGRAASMAGCANHLRTGHELTDRRSGGGSLGVGGGNADHGGNERQGRVLTVRAGWGDHVAVPECRLQAPHRGRWRG